MRIVLILTVCMFSGLIAEGDFYHFEAGNFGYNEKNWYFASIRESFQTGEIGMYTVYFWNEDTKEGDYRESYNWNGKIERIPDPRGIEVDPTGPFIGVSGKYNVYNEDYSAWGYGFVHPRTGRLTVFVYHDGVFENGADAIDTLIEESEGIYQSTGTTALGNDYSISLDGYDGEITILKDGYSLSYSIWYVTPISKPGTFFVGMYNIDDRSFPWIYFRDADLWGYCVGQFERNFWFYNWNYGWCWTSNYYWPWIYQYSGEWIKLEVEEY